ncbi:MAG: threonylcarbamoyl-AMP synthase [Endomicrobium sp.]|jgi:L-threonylcarbamoyladenylate synthase|nr:threonylcarbamoyl-AMP synthase [Endomicrobium sp.]
MVKNVTLKILSKDKMVYKKTAEIIKNGGVAIVPTETVYGFAVDAFNIEAQKNVYKIKERSHRKPFILMTKDIESVKIFVKIPQKIFEIAKRFWPGQLTLIFPTTEIGKIVSGGRKDLGVRIPDNRFMLSLLNEIKRPIFTTSVNLSNTRSAKNVKETLNFDGIVDVIVNGGQCKFSLESTVVDMVQFPYTVVRKGCFDASKLLRYM